MIPWEANEEKLVPVMVSDRQVITYLQQLENRPSYWQRLKSEAHLLFITLACVGIAGAIAFYTIWMNTR